MKAKTNFPRTGKLLIVSWCASALAVTTFAIGETNNPPLTDRPASPQYQSPEVNRDQSLTPQQFVRQAALSGQKEIQLSELALEKSTHPEVKKFAHAMVQDHTQANRQLRQIAQANAIELPPTNAFARAIQSPQKLETPRGRETFESTEPRRAESTPGVRSDRPESKTMIPESDLQAAEKLQRLTGAEFDRAYALEMRQDHEKVVQKFEKAAASLEHDALKRFAADTLPKLRHHKQMADQLVQQVGPSALGE